MQAAVAELFRVPSSCVTEAANKRKDRKKNEWSASAGIPWRAACGNGFGPYHAPPHRLSAAELTGSWPDAAGRLPACRQSIILALQP